MLVACYILVSHLVQGQHKCSTKFSYTQLFVLGMLPNFFKNIRYSPVMAVFLKFNPLFDANILNHINDMISSLIL